MADDPKLDLDLDLSDVFGATAAPSGELTANDVFGADDLGVDLSDIFGSSAAPAAPAAQPDSGGRSFLNRIIDPFGTTEELGKGIVSATAGAAAGVGRIIGADEFADTMAAAAQNDRWTAQVGSYHDVDSVNAAAKYVYGLLGQSAPDMVAVTAATVGGTVVTGGNPFAGIAAGYVTATTLHTGRNAQRQIDEGANPDDISWSRATTAGALMAALDVVPIAAGMKFGGRIAEVFDDAASRGAVNLTKSFGKNAGIEASTEVVQQFAEAAQAKPGNTERILNPQTDEDVEYSKQVFNEMLEAGIGGGVLGGGLGAAGDATGAPQRPAAPTAPATPAAGATKPPAVPADPRDDYLNRLQSVESGGNPAAQNPKSSAGGLFQFTDGTWLQYIKQYRPDLAAGRTDPQIVGLKSIARLNREMANRYTEASEASLVAADLPVTNATLGVMHRFGQDGGRTVLEAAKADPETPVAQVVDPGVMNANPDLAGRSVGDVVEWYEQKLGAGNTFVSGANTPELGYADVQRNEDRRATPLESLTTAEQGKSLAEAFQAKYGEDFSERPPQRVVDKLRAKLEGMPLEDKLDYLRKISRGEELVRDETVSPLLAARAARDALVDLGFDPAGLPSDEKFDPSKPSFNSTKTLRLEREITEKFGPTGFVINEDTGGKVFAEVFHRAAAVLNIASRAAKNGTRRNELNLLHDKAMAARAAVQELVKKKGTAARQADLRKTIADAIKALQAEDNRRVQRYHKAVAETKARAAAQNWAPARLKKELKRIGNSDVSQGEPYSYTVRGVGKHIEAAIRSYDPLGRIADMAEYQRNILKAAGDIDDALSVAGYAEARSLRREIGQAENRKKAEIDKNRRTQRAAEAERSKAVRNEDLAKSEQRAIAAERQRAQELMVAAEQARSKTGLNPKTRQFATSMELLAGAEPETAAQRRDAESTSHKLVDAAMNLPGAGVADWFAKRIMPNQYIARTYGRVFDNVQYRNAWMNPILARLKASQAGDADRRAHVEAAATALNTAADQLREAASARGIDAGEAHEQMSYMAVQATQYEAHLLDPTTGGAIDIDESFMSGDDLAAKHGLATVPPNGINHHIPPERHGYVRELHRRFMAGPQQMRDAYRELRDYIKRGDDELLLQAINARRRQVGLPVVQNLGIALDPTNPANSALTDELRKAIMEVRGAKRRGDYFPLNRNGRFSVFASETKAFIADTEADALQRFKEAAKADPHLRPAGRTATPHAEMREGRWHVQAERPYFRLFDSVGEAEAARAQLDALRTGIGVPMADPSLENFKPDVVGAVAEQDQYVYGAAGLNEAQAAAIQELASDNLDLRNLLIDLLPERNISAGLRSRDNVLGVQPKMLNIIQKRGVLVANQLGELVKRPAVRQVLQEMEQQRDAMRAKADAERNPSRRLALQSRANKQTKLLNFVREADAQEARRKHPVWQQFNSIGSRTATVWFLSGLSHPIINTLQVMTYGVGQFAGRYGPAGVMRLARNNARAMLLAAEASFRHGADEGYFADNVVLDARLFENPHDARLADMEAVANRPADPTGYRIDKNTGFADTLLLSRFEVDLYMAARLSMNEIKVISQSRKGRHLGSTFFEEMQVQRLAAGNLRENATEYGKGVIDRSYRVATFLPSAVEYANRLSIVLATVEAETARRGQREFDAIEVADIETSAGDLNARVNVDYSTANRSVLQRYAGVFAQFTSFPITMMLESILMMKALVRPGNGYTRSEAFSALAGQTLMVGTLAGGIGATPFAAYVAIKTTAAVVAEMFADEGDDDDLLAQIKTWGFDKGLEKNVRAAFGDTAANLLFEGPAGVVTNTALRERLGVHQPPVFIRDGSLTDGEEGLQKLVFEFAGPVPSMVATFAEAFDRWEDLTPVQRAEKLAPKGARDLLRGYRYSTDGLKDSQGRVMISPEQFSFTDGVFQQLLGFTPLTVSDIYQKRSAYFERQDAAAEDKSSLYKKAFEEGVDPEAVADFNDEYPNDPIKGRNLRQAIKSRYETEAGYGATGGLPLDDPELAAEINSIFGGE